MRKIILFFAVLLIDFVSFAQPSKGNAAPEISLPNASGNSILLSSLKGKIVLIDFWASWCGPCRASNAELHNIYEKYKSKGFEIYGISVDNDVNSWLKAVQQDKIDWMQVNDATGRVADKWNIDFIPNSFLLDANGKVIAENLDEKQLNKMLNKLLN